MIFFRKNISEYRILEKYKIDIEQTNKLYREGASTKPYGGREYCELVSESEDFRFYGYLTYSDRSGGYILRQEKQKPNKVVYFGENKTFNQVFHGYLFQVKAFATSGFGDSEELMITARNIVTGQQTCFKWLSGKFLWKQSYNGHANSQDRVNSVKVENDKLIFEVTRKKSGELTNDKYDIDTDYVLEVVYNGWQFKATAIFPPIE